MTHPLFVRLAAIATAALIGVSAVSAQAQTPAPTPAPAAPAAKAKKAPAALAANQFQTDTEAKGHCASDTVVWVNTKSKVYHYAGSSSYGKTKRGAYMCEKEATGFRAAKGEKKKS